MSARIEKLIHGQRVVSKDVDLLKNKYRLPRKEGEESHRNDFHVGRGKGPTEFLFPMVHKGPKSPLIGHYSCRLVTGNR